MSLTCGPCLDDVARKFYLLVTKEGELGVS